MMLNTSEVKLTVTPHLADWPSTRGHYTVKEQRTPYDPPRHVDRKVNIPRGTEVTLVEWVQGSQGHTKQFAKVQTPEGLTVLVSSYDLSPVGE